MNRVHLYRDFLWQGSVALMGVLVGMGQSLAQVIPDNTLPTPTQVNLDPSNPNLLHITAGTQPTGSSDLFHSFSRFSLGAGQTALFENSLTIANIFARITGGEASSIDGTIAANSFANLFLLNPNGILFGPNARLNLGGSFLATTADSLQFQQGFFSATQPNTPPLLTVNIPVGLQMGVNPGSIQVQGQGHALTAPSPLFQAFDRGIPPSVLQVNSGQSLVLLGGDIVADGGVLMAEQGNIELGSVKGDLVNLTLNPPGLGLGLSYDNVRQFGDIALMHQSLADVSAPSFFLGGLRAGSIQVQGKQINLQDGSLLLAQNEGLLTSGAITVKAQDTLNIVGTDPRSGGLVRTGIVNNARGLGNGGDVNVSTGELFVAGGGAITSSTFGLGNSGNVNINANAILLDGVSPLNPVTNSVIASITFFSGNAGQVKLSTQQLTLIDEAAISSITLGSGHGGNIEVNARDSISVSGAEETAIFPGGIVASTVNRGDAGDITLNTAHLDLDNGGFISSLTSASGKGGIITLNAEKITANNRSLINSNSTFLEFSQQQLLNAFSAPTGDAGDIVINARSLDLQNGSSIGTLTTASGTAGNISLNVDTVNVQGSSFIASNAVIPEPVFQQQFGIVAPTGQSGSIEIQGNRLTLDDRAFITVSNEGTNRAGMIRIDVNAMTLDRQSFITAATASGEGGNIRLQTDQNLVLRRGSQITTSAGGTGNGGDIDLTTQFLIAPPGENSDIIANAFAGNGGNIQISATGILGTAFRETLTQASDIVASSEFGTSGTVTLTRPEVDVSSGLAELPSQLTDPSSQISDRCAAVQGNSFTATGSGGLPENPIALIRGQTLWQDAETPPLQEATGWTIDATGQVTLAAQLPGRSPPPLNSSALDRGQTLNQQGHQLFNQGQTTAALEAWQQAEQAYQQAGDQTGQWGSRLNQAQALQGLGRYRRSLSLLQALITDLQHQPDSLLKAKALRSFGVALQTNSDSLEAKAVLEQSWSVSDRLKAPAETAATLLSIGNIAWDLQQPEDAIAYYTKAAQLSSDPLLQTQAQLNQLTVLLATQKQEPALALIPAIQATLAKLPLSQAAVYARLNLADRLTTMLQGEQQQNRQLETLTANLSTTALQQAQTMDDRRAESYALQQLGNFYLKHQQWQQALMLTQQSLQLAQALETADITALAAQQLGFILKHQGDLPQAIAAYEIAFDALQNLRRDLVAINPHVQFSLRQSVEPTYRELVSLLLQNSDSLGKARDVLEALQLSELDNFFGDACLNTKPVKIDEIDTHAAVIYPIILDDRLEVILSLPHQPSRHYTTPLPKAQVEQAIFQFMRYLNPAFFQEDRFKSAEQLYDWLIRPAEADLRQHDIQTLVFVLDGYLKNVPMAALYDGQHYLIENYGVAVSPGLQLFPEGSQHQNQGLLAAAITEAHKGFTALPGAAREVAEITTGEKNTGKKSLVLINQQFTRAAFQKALEQTAFPIVHLATHGQFSANPEDTFLLAWDDRINVRDLNQLFERHKLGLENPIELLVLSACQTATGDDRAALGLAGFALRSGARSTIASLWAADDQATADLMSEFYRQLSDRPGITKAEALRQAQLSIIHKNAFYAANPYFWGAFVLIGNWL
jgi:filamentous hemagglutinin family protein